MKRYLLIDCNNFFVSCERIFNAKLENKPVVVLSSNDGCVISRSKEAKDIGIAMGVPAYQCKDIFKKHNVTVLSSNFTLYGDISRRVMQTLADFATDIEIYSIDEAFVYIKEYTNDKDFNDIYYTEYAKYIRHKIKQFTGISVSIGIGLTKTQAKLANKIAKKNLKYNGVFDITCAYNDIDLRKIDVGDIWGIGYRYSKLLKAYKINNIYDFMMADPKWVRKKLTIMGFKTQTELKGVCAIDLEQFEDPKKSICVSKSFGTNVTSLVEIKQALSHYVTRACEKLRAQNSIAYSLTVFLMSNRYHDTQYYFNSHTVSIDLATSYTPDFIAIGNTCLENIYMAGYGYKKVGVIFGNIVPDEFIQMSTISIDSNKEKKSKVMRSVDSINNTYGSNKLFFASSSIEALRLWKSKQAHRSQNFTTKWNEILTIDI